jgi:PKD repeat protein
VPTVTITAGTNNVGEVGIPTVITLEPPAAATSNAIREVVLNLGDGTVRNLGALLARTTVAHTYNRAGVYTVTATATDVMNFTATSSIALTVNEAATIPVTILATPGSGGIVNFSASITGAIGGGGSIRTYEWSFGDGGSATTTGPSTSHRYTTAGTYVVRLRVVTTTGQEGYAEQTVRVTI